MARFTNIEYPIPFSFFKEEKISLKFSYDDFKSVSKSLKKLSTSNQEIFHQKFFFTKNINYKQIRIHFNKNFSTEETVLKTELENFIKNNVTESNFNLDPNKVSRTLCYI